MESARVTRTGKSSWARPLALNGDLEAVKPQALIEVGTP
jgi:hypothetical protein